MKPFIRLIIASFLLVLTAGCACNCDKVFARWYLWDDAAKTKAHFNASKNVILVRIDESHWEDIEHTASRAHFKGTVMRSYQGDWRASQRIAYVKLLDYAYPDATRPKPNQHAGELVVLSTDKNTDQEIEIDTGDDLNYDREMKHALDCVFGRE
jgi:hypothetical protein